MGDGLTGPIWVTWQVQMMSLLALCEVEPYVWGEIQQPNKETDLVGHENWRKNDNYAKHLVTQNVGEKAIIHIQHGTTHVAWKNLEAIYEDKCQETIENTRVTLGYVHTNLYLYPSNPYPLPSWVYLSKWAQKHPNRARNGSDTS